MQYQFAHNRDGNGPTREVAESIVASGCHRVGLKIGSDDAEYPLRQMLRNRGFTGEIHHVNVENESGRIPTRGGEPCVFILKNVEINWEKVPGVSRQFGSLTVIFSGNRKQGRKSTVRGSSILSTDERIAACFLKLASPRVLI